MNLALFYFILLIIGVIVAGFNYENVFGSRSGCFAVYYLHGFGLFAFVYYCFYQVTSKGSSINFYIGVENEQHGRFKKKLSLTVLKEEHLKFTKI